MEDPGKFFKGKSVLVAGGTGTIGIPLVKKLIEFGADVVVASLDNLIFARKVFGNDIDFKKVDLTQYDNCVKVTRGKNIVFNLLGIKGSVGIGQRRAASYLVPMIRFQTNLMDAAFKNGIERFLFVSSICAYPESAVPKKEDTVWEGLPKQNDRIPGLAKRIGEVQAEAYLEEWGWKAVRIVRPANVYGPFDDFDPRTAQVIPAIIARASRGENPLSVWGDGTAVRDFIYSEDVAEAALMAIVKAPPCYAINIGSGMGIKIKELAAIITKMINPKIKIEWDDSKPAGDAVRILSVDRARKILGFEARTDILRGIMNTINWYRNDYKLFKKLKYSSN